MRCHINRIPFFFCMLLIASVQALQTWDQAYQQANAALQKMSNQDKINIVSGAGWSVKPCVGNTIADSLQGVSGFNGLCLQDSPSGVRYTTGNSVFPSALNLAATFDRDLMLQQAELMADEFKGKGVNIALAPMMNMLRSPFGGRNWEGYGADPYLTSEAARLAVRGFNNRGVMSTAKHFIANEQEQFRETSSSNVDERTLHEFYLPPFKASVEEGVPSIMCAYNLFNGTYACESDYLLNQILKKELGFRGFVMTDWWATKKTKESAVGGSDMMMPGTDAFGSNNEVWGPNLLSAVQSGQVPQSRLDDMAKRILAAWYKLGQDNGYPAVNLHSFDPSKAKNVDVRADHNLHIRKVGAASSILLKNTGNILPLQAGVSLAIVGDDAGPGQTSSNGCSDHGCASGTIPQGWGSGTANFASVVTPLDGITKRSPNSKIQSSLDNNDLNKAKTVAQQSDYAIVFVFANSGEAYITVEGNPGDRNDLNLWHNGNALIEAVASVNKNTIVVIHGPGAVNMPWINNPNVKAVIHALFPGEETGNAIAQVLFGDVNPSGRLPFTIAKQESDYSAKITLGQPIVQVPYTEGLFVDYRHFDARNIEPLFPFGFGLSFTTFAYSNFRANYPTSKSDTFSVSFQLSNTGKVNGHEVPQLYLGFPRSAQEPPKNLRNFARVFVNAGQQASVTLDIPSNQMQIWDVNTKQWITPSGQFTVFVGASSRDIKWQGSFTLN
ncbi:glycoside hydrolase superfamily [Gorgonomyces haynaldii]|nr:glycoside hydrolase superfamily [Gorgonomyces haynaldii]